MKNFFTYYVLPLLLVLSACTTATPQATQVPSTATPTFTATLTTTPLPSATKTLTATATGTATPSDACKTPHQPYAWAVDVGAIISGAATRQVTIYTSEKSVWLILEKGEKQCFDASLTPAAKRSYGKYYLTVEIPVESSDLKLIRPTIKPLVFGGDVLDPGSDYDYVSVLLFPATATPTATVPTSTSTPSNTPTRTPSVTPTPSRTPTSTVTLTVTPVVINP